MSGSSKQQAALRPCPGCGKAIPSAAERCLSCGAALDPSLASTAAMTAPETTAESPQVEGNGPADCQVRPVTSSANSVSRLRLSTSRLLEQGSMVGEYRINGLLGQGGMGAVYADEQPVIGKKVAIKVLHSVLSEDPEAMRRFVAEARAVNTIGHPNIIDIFAFGTFEDGTQYYVMEFLAGRSLAAYLAEHRTAAPDDVLEFMPQVLDALESAHRHGIVHRDLKPDDIYLADHLDGGYLVKLLDFGVAKFTEEGILEGKTRTGVPIGTPVYMSPEQCIGEGVDHRSDIYAIGVILYELLTG